MKKNMTLLIFLLAVLFLSGCRVSLKLSFKDYRYGFAWSGAVNESRRELTPEEAKELYRLINSAADVRQNTGLAGTTPEYGIYIETKNEGIIKLCDSGAGADFELQTNGKSWWINDDSLTEYVGTLYPEQADNASKPESIEPPYMLVFNDLQLYYDFKNSPDLSDHYFKAFITENDYSMNGIYTKEDVLSLCEVIDGIPVPLSDQFEFSQMSIYPETNICVIQFRYAGAVSCTFLIVADSAGNTKPFIEEAKKNGNLQAITTKSNTLSNVYYVNNKKDDNTEAYYAVINGYLVLFRAFDTPAENALCILESASFGSLSELP